MTRAAVLFASATAVASCGSTENDDGSSGFIPVPPYGLPPFDAGADADTTRDAARDASGDAARDSGGDAEPDAGDAASDAKNEGGIVPPYGLAPIDD